MLGHEISLGYELLRSLSDAQCAVAVVSPDALDDVVAGVGRAQSLTRYEGLPARELDAAQQRVLWALVEEYVRNADFEAADAQLEAIKAADLEKLFFSWRGPTNNPAAPVYYRVHGPRILSNTQCRSPTTFTPLRATLPTGLGLHYQEHAFGGGRRSASCAERLK